MAGAGLILSMDKKQVFRWFTKANPVTPLEAEWMDKINSIDMEIFFHKFNMIAYTGKEVMVKVGCTPAMTGTDLNCAIYTASGDVAVSGMGVYAHALSGQGPIKYFKEFFSKSVGIEAGDVFFASDPYIGGTHVNDQILAAPVFSDGELIAWVAAGCHQGEVGCVEVGMSPASKNRYGDGMNCTTMKIGENWTLREDLVTVLANMTRDQQNWILDIRARYAALVYMHGEIEKLCREKGAAYIAGGLRRLIKDAEETAEKKVLQYNDGTYRGVIFMDSLGDEVGLLRVCFTLKKKGEAITVDYTGTSPQIPGSINCYSFTMPGSLVMYLMPYIFHDLTTSLGVLGPFIDYVCPEGCLINPDPQASVSLGVMAIFAVCVLTAQVMGKMAFASPDRNAVAATQGWGFDVMQCLVKNQRGLMNAGLVLDCNAMGQGGRVNEDGTDSMNPPWAALADCLESEWYEKDAPFLFLFRKHAVDSGGFGKFRGGSGIESCWVAHDLAFGMMTSVGGATKVPAALGLFGGYASMTGPAVTLWGSNYMEMIEQGVEFPKSRKGLVERFKDKVNVGARQITMRPYTCGDILTSQNPGGGGYGDVLERDPDLVAKDLRENAISHWAAENVYKVAYDKDTLVPDEKRTEELRAAERANRKKRGKRYEEFEKDWLRLRPPKEALKHFGDWEWDQS